MSRNYRDDVIETLAASEAALIEGVIELTIERDAWRLVAQQAICRMTELARTNEMIDRRRYVHRRHMDAQRPDEMADRQEAA